MCCWRQQGPKQAEGFSRIPLVQVKDDPWRTNKCWQSDVLGTWLCWVFKVRFHCLKPIVLQFQITECFLGVHELGAGVSRGLVKGRMVSLLISFSVSSSFISPSGQWGTAGISWFWNDHVLSVLFCYLLTTFSHFFFFKLLLFQAILSPSFLLISLFMPICTLPPADLVGLCKLFMCYHFNCSSSNRSELSSNCAV